MGEKLLTQGLRLHSFMLHRFAETPMIRPLQFVIVLLCVGAATYCQENNSFDSQVEAARDAQGSGDFTTAATYYQRAAAIRPNVPELWSNLGLMQDVTGNYKEAIMSFQKAEHLKPELYVPNLFLGIDYLHIRCSLSKQFLSCRKRRSSTPTMRGLCSTLGRAYESLQDYAAAGSAVSTRSGTRSDESFRLVRFWCCDTERGRDGRRDALRRSPALQYSRELYAESLGKQLRFKEATTEMQAVLAIDRHFACAHAQLGFFYLAEQQAANAAQEFAAEAQNCGLAGLGQAELRIQAGDNAMALSLLSGLWKRDPGFCPSQCCASCRKFG